MLRMAPVRFLVSPPGMQSNFILRLVHTRFAVSRASPYRFFASQTSHGLTPSKSTPPASETTAYVNRFDQAAHPSLWQIEKEERKRIVDSASNSDNSELINANVEHEDLVVTSQDPHKFGSIIKSLDTRHYNEIWEPTFPRNPDLSKGELASGANVTRTAVWHDPKEPAIVSVSRFTPDHFRPAGASTMMPVPDSANCDAFPDFRDYRLPAGHADRRPFMYFVSAGSIFMAASLVRSVICKAIHHYWIAKDAVALGSTEVDISPVGPGQQITVKWRGKPVFVKHRTPEQIARARKEDEIIDTMKDPELDSERTKKPEWLVSIGVCTHLGCIPVDGGDYHGYFCPCHGSHYDTSGRIRQGPAPANLEIPPYKFIDDTTILIG